MSGSPLAYVINYMFVIFEDDCLYPQIAICSEEDPAISFSKNPCNFVSLHISLSSTNPEHTVMASVAGARNPPNGAIKPDASDTLKMHPYTCNTCQVAFRTSDLQRTHMRTDWQYVRCHQILPNCIFTTI